MIRASSMNWTIAPASPSRQSSFSAARRPSRWSQISRTVPIPPRASSPRSSKRAGLGGRRPAGGSLIAWFRVSRVPRWPGRAKNADRAPSPRVDPRTRRCYGRTRMAPHTGAGALAGIHVIDFSHQAAGPWCTSLLGDMGADVIKVEKPGRGDSIRYADRTGRLPPEVGGLNFQGLNRNKRAITIDIGQDAGVALARRLVRGADVLVENFRPGVMDRHGLGWDAMHAENPRLV